MTPAERKLRILEAQKNLRRACTMFLITRPINEGLRAKIVEARAELDKVKEGA